MSSAGQLADRSQQKTKKIFSDTISPPEHLKDALGILKGLNADFGMNEKYQMGVLIRFTLVTRRFNSHYQVQYMSARDALRRDLSRLFGRWLGTRGVEVEFVSEGYTVKPHFRIVIHVMPDSEVSFSQLCAWEFPQTLV